MPTPISSSLSPDMALPEDWTVVARYGNYSWWQVLLCLVFQGPPVEPLTITLIARQESTRVTHSVTAHNEYAAVTKIINGEFDPK
jgi:hypothetical protein